MRWRFWEREESKDSMAWDDEAREDEGQDTELEAEGDGDGEEPELDPETQALVERARQTAREEYQAEVRAAAQRHGLDWTGQGFGVTNAQALVSGFGLVSAEQEAAQPQQSPAAVETPPELDPYDVESVQRFVAWQVEQGVKRATAPLAEENQRLRQMQAEDRAGAAVTRVGDAVRKYAPYLEPVLEHPEMAARLREAMLTQDPAAWSDERNLARLVGVLAPDLDMGALPKRAPAEQPRDTQGRYASDAHRRALAQATPSPSAGRVPPDSYDELERSKATYLGITPQDVRLARHTNIEDWRRERAARQKQTRR